MAATPVYQSSAGAAPATTRLNQHQLQGGPNTVPAASVTDTAAAVVQVVTHRLLQVSRLAKPPNNLQLLMCG